MFNKKMAAENKRARELAAQLLPGVWSYEHERTLNTGEAVADYIRSALKVVSEQIQPELPGVPIERIRSQVANVMVKKRSKK